MRGTRPSAASAEPGPPIGLDRKIETDADRLDATVVELTVRRSAGVELHKELQLGAAQERMFDLDARSDRDVLLPIALLAKLEIRSGDRTQKSRDEGLRTVQLDTGLQDAAVEGGLAMDENASAAVEAQPLPGVIGHQHVECFEGEIDAVDLDPEQVLVAEVGTLVIGPENRSEIAEVIGRRQPNQEVTVDQIRGARLEIEDREDAGLESDLPLTPIVSGLRTKEKVSPKLADPTRSSSSSRM